MQEEGWKEELEDNKEDGDIIMNRYLSVAIYQDAINRIKINHLSSVCPLKLLL
jgi:hypothetical protein